MRFVLEFCSTHPGFMTVDEIVSSPVSETVLYTALLLHKAVRLRAACKALNPARLSKLP